MDTRMAKELIRLIRAERNKKFESVKTEEDYSNYKAIEEPFIDELCLMLLVAIRHEIERTLVFYVARKTSKGKGFKDDELRKWVKKKNDKRNWKEFSSILGLDVETEKWMETLRHLSNSYKHDAWDYRGAFLKALGLKEGENYATPLTESPAIQKRLAESVGLASDADYSVIAEAFVDRVSDLFSMLETEHGVMFWPFIFDPNQWPQ